MTEEQILREVLNGHTELYGRIFSSHWQRAYNLAFHYTRHKEDSMDVVQEAFIKAYRNLSRFEPARDFGPWLLTIVRNLAIDLLRKRKKWSEVPEQVANPKSLRRAEQRVLRQELWSALSTLDNEQQELIFLKDYQGHSYAEIARILDIPLGTVMSRLHYARKKLAEILKVNHHAV